MPAIRIPSLHITSTSRDYNAHLPESSIRIARALKLFPEQKTKRLKLLLEAAYSSFVRYQTNKLYTDLEFSKSVQAEVDQAINEFNGNDPVKINSGWQRLGLDDISDVPCLLHRKCKKA